MSQEGSWAILALGVENLFCLANHSCMVITPHIDWFHIIYIDIMFISSAHIPDMRRKSIFQIMRARAIFAILIPQNCRDFLWPLTLVSKPQSCCEFKGWKSCGDSLNLRPMSLSCTGRCKCYNSTICFSMFLVLFQSCESCPRVRHIMHDSLDLISCLSIGSFLNIHMCVCIFFCGLEFCV